MTHLIFHKTLNISGDEQKKICCEAVIAYYSNIFKQTNVALEDEEYDDVILNCPLVRESQLEDYEPTKKYFEGSYLSSYIYDGLAYGDYKIDIRPLKTDADMDVLMQKLQSYNFRQGRDYFLVNDDRGQVCAIGLKPFPEWFCEKICSDIFNKKR